MKFTHSAVELIPYYPWVCSHNTFAVRNYILCRCLTGFHMKILSKSNYRVRLNVNMDIIDSISFYFNFGKDYYFVLRLKQHFFDKARFFLMNRVNPAIVDWRRKEVETCARRSLSFESFLDKITSFPLTPRLYRAFQRTDQEIPWRIRTLWNVIRAMNRREGFYDEGQSHCFTETWF